MSMAPSPLISGGGASCVFEMVTVFLFDSVMSSCVVSGSRKSRVPLLGLGFVASVLELAEGEVVAVDAGEVGEPVVFFSAARWLGGGGISTGEVLFPEIKLEQDERRRGAKKWKGSFTRMRLSWERMPSERGGGNVEKFVSLRAFQFFREVGGGLG